MNINGAAAAVGETPRQIRYLIAEGFIPNPEGSRAKPDYRQIHADAIRRYQLLRKDYKPAQIKVLLEAERLVRDGEQIALAPGVILTVAPKLLDPNAQPRAIGDLVAAALEAIIKHLSKETPDAA